MGEYTVLDGSLAFALPTVYGQYLTIAPGKGKAIHWVSEDADGSVWFEAEILFNDIISNAENGDSIYNTLITILHEAYKANPVVLNNSEGFTVTTQLTFPRRWGLGSSSTLINNIAQWFGVDAFKLLADSFGGSGYDIACAQNNTPILYHIDNGKPITKPVSFNPDFTGNLHFIYLNKKQNSRSAIAAYREKRGDSAPVVAKVNKIIGQILQAKTLDDFRKSIDAQEGLLSKMLEVPTVKQSLFPDFNGSLKSLGGWGGDFILAASPDDPTEYFSAKGYTTIIPYNKMILK